MEVLIDKATSEKNTEDNWDVILLICDEYARKDPKSCIKSILNKLGNSDANVNLRAITLLDACTKNCGPIFNHILSSEFVNKLKSTFSNRSRPVQVRLIEVFERWSNEMTEPELSNARGLYQWVETAKPELTKHITEEKKLTKANQHRAAECQAKEDEEVAKAIALSLKETQSAKPLSHSPVLQQPATEQPSFSYPTAAVTQPNSNIASSAVSSSKVRALYDFEAVEDNELTFKAGDLILLLDSNDPNWWKGQGQGGNVGLFPAQFVAMVPPEEINNEPSRLSPLHQHQPVVNDGPVQVSKDKLDRCLRLLNSADPTTGEQARPDPVELASLEAECRLMGPLIARDLAQVDQQAMALDDLNQGLMEAFEHYHDLMLIQAGGGGSMGYQQQPMPYYGVQSANGFYPPAPTTGYPMPNSGYPAPPQPGAAGPSNPLANPASYPPPPTMSSQYGSRPANFNGTYAPSPTSTTQFQPPS